MDNEGKWWENNDDDDDDDDDGGDDDDDDDDDDDGGDDDDDDDDKTNMLCINIGTMIGSIINNIFFWVFDSSEMLKYSVLMEKSSGCNGTLVSNTPISGFPRILSSLQIQD